MNEDQWCPPTLTDREQHNEHQRYCLYSEPPTPKEGNGSPKMTSLFLYFSLWEDVVVLKVLTLESLVGDVWQT